MDVDYISATGGVMSFTKLRLRMERRRNKINKLPTLVGALVHKHSREHPWNSRKTRDGRTRYDRGTGWREDCSQTRAFSDEGSIWLWAVGFIISALSFFSECVWDTPGHSSDFLSANHDALRRQGEVAKTWRHRDQTQSLHLNLKQNYRKPLVWKMQLQQTNTVWQESLLWYLFFLSVSLVAVTWPEPLWCPWMCTHIKEFPRCLLYLSGSD